MTVGIARSAVVSLQFVQGPGKVSESIGPRRPRGYVIGSPIEPIQPKSPIEMKAEAYCRIAEEAFVGQAKAYINATDKVISELSKDDAERNIQEVSETGKYGETALSEKLFSYAQAYAGSTPSQPDVERIRETFTWGFEDAGRLLNRRLPDISFRTFNTVLLKFDEWLAKL